jgi:hypothetical protein
MKEDTYLGDSVYAHDDGYNVILTTQNSLLDDPSNTIALEPEVLAKLFEYAGIQKPANGEMQVELHYHQDTSGIRVLHYRQDWTEELIYLGVQTVNIPKHPQLSHEELAEKIVARLRLKQQKVQAEAFAESQQIEERIQSLLALPAPSLDDIPL